jgi:hypothetical protein
MDLALQIAIAVHIFLALTFAVFLVSCFLLSFFHAFNITSCLQMVQLHVAVPPKPFLGISDSACLLDCTIGVFGACYSFFLKKSERLTVAFMIDLQNNKMDLVLIVQYNTIQLCTIFCKGFLRSVFAVYR